ncbi:O-methyltransferase [Rivihabitans pingtungensis]|uniref:Putative O-methyltransferase YrrM n=1 Tax=Rivihabitans pingtungensis TaxID=1054498 RepID=A0A318KVG0_9NEIS|nr:class I SAM-dependent methyltransferase [Rivihabitans pingtungensis]PXX81800.1 putative O-methyltransferase YrrM [Rivihabitans pingtungensis]
MLTPALLQQLDRLAQHGQKYDAKTLTRADKMLNITPDTGMMLYQWLRFGRPAHVVEIGTSNGYSTLWLAAAAQAYGGRVTSLDVLQAKTTLARNNLNEAGLLDTVTLVTAEAGSWLRQQAAESAQLIFLDADRSLYASYWPLLTPVLAPGGLIVVDNAVSHAAECADFFARVRATPGFLCELLPIGKGEFIILKD